MNILIAGGTGFIGQFLVDYFNKKNYQITVLGRSIKKIRNRYHNKVAAIDWQRLESQGSYAIKKFDLIINLTGAGIADKRWSSARKKELLDSRIKSTKLIVKLCCQLGEQSPELFNASATSVYGIQQTSQTGLPPALDETTDINFDDHKLFSAKLTRLWEKTTWPARDAGIRVVNLRFGVVFGQDGGALARMIVPFKLYLGGKIGSGKQPFSWVCIIDLARAIEFLITNKKLTGPVNIISPKCITQAELANALSKAIHRPALLPTPAFMMKVLFGELANELLLHGQNVYPKILIDQGFQFKYSDIDRALAYALKRGDLNDS